MKVIVAYWVKPFEYPEGMGFDQRPKSIERLSTSADELRKFLHKVHAKDGDVFIQWADSVSGLCDPRLKTTHKVGNDGFAYLQRCLDKDEIGVCAAHIIGRQGEYYYGFQVRNIH